MTEQTRRRLPNRREHELIDFDLAGFRYTAGLGRYDDGTLAEIFLNASKSGTSIEAQAQDAAIVTSIALQHGVPAEAIRHAIKRHSSGEAAGPIGKLLDMLAEGRK
jgi:hypothetical protein